MSSVRNTVVIAIMQVGVIVAAVLAAGICQRVWTDREWPVPPLAGILYNHGVAALLIPLVWVTGAVMLQTRSGVSEDIRVLMFWLGVLVLLALVVFAIYGMCRRGWHSYEIPRMPMIWDNDLDYLILVLNRESVVNLYRTAAASGSYRINQ